MKPLDLFLDAKVPFRGNADGRICPLCGYTQLLNGRVGGDGSPTCCDKGQDEFYRRVYGQNYDKLKCKHVMEYWDGECPPLGIECPLTQTNRCPAEYTRADHLADEADAAHSSGEI